LPIRQAVSGHPNDAVDRLIGHLNTVVNYTADYEARYFDDDSTKQDFRDRGLVDFRSVSAAAIELAFSLDSTLVAEYPRKTTLRGGLLDLEARAYGYDDIQLWALWALGVLSERGHTSAVDAIIGCFDSYSDDWLCDQAMVCLTEHSGPALPRLKLALANGHPGHYWIKSTMMRIGHPNAIDPFVDELLHTLIHGGSDLEEVAAALSKASPSVIPRLVDAVHSSTGSYRVWYYAGVALSLVKNHGALGELGKACQDENAWIRENSIKALGNMRGSARASSLAINALTDTQPQVRYYAAESIGLISRPAWSKGLDGLWNRFQNLLMTPSEVEALIDALQDPDNNVRCMSAWALGEIGDRRAIPALEEAGDCKEPLLKEEIALALGKIGHPDALAWLRTGSRDNCFVVRDAALWAVSQIDTTVVWRSPPQGSVVDSTLLQGALVPGENLKAHWRIYTDVERGRRDWWIPASFFTEGKNWLGLPTWASVSIESSDPYPSHAGRTVFSLSDYTMILRIRGEFGGGENMAHLHRRP